MARYTLCTPAFIFLIIIIIEMLYEYAYLGTRDPLPIVVIAFIIVLFIVWLLNYLCSKEYKSISWAIVLLPYVLSVIGYSLYGNENKFLPSIFYK